MIEYRIGDDKGDIAFFAMSFFCIENFVPIRKNAPRGCVHFNA